MPKFKSIALMTASFLAMCLGASAQLTDCVDMCTTDVGCSSTRQGPSQCTQCHACVWVPYSDNDPRYCYACNGIDLIYGATRPAKARPYPLRADVKPQQKGFLVRVFDLAVMLMPTMPRAPKVDPMKDHDAKVAEYIRYAKAAGVGAKPKACIKLDIASMALPPVATALR
jgi:hypothetical protein